MLIKLLPLLLFLMSCGQEVQLKNSKLSSSDTLSDGQTKSYLKSGVLTKGTPSKVQYQGQLFTVSEYSSKSTELFISALSSGVQVPIQFTGGIQGKEIVIESIKKQ